MNRFTLAIADTTFPSKEAAWLEFARRRDPRRRQVPEDQIERAGVAFGLGGIAVLAVYGRNLENEAAEGEIHSYFSEGATHSDPEEGIWVWEGIPRGMYSRDWESGYDEFEGYDLTKGVWRKATVLEAQCFINGESPWGSALPETEIDSIDPEPTGFEALLDFAK